MRSLVVVLMMAASILALQQTQARAEVTCNPGASLSLTSAGQVYASATAYCSYRYSQTAVATVQVYRGDVDTGGKSRTCTPTSWSSISGSSAQCRSPYHYTTNLSGAQWYCARAYISFKNASNAAWEYKSTESCTTY